MAIKIVTGKTGTPHVESSDDAALYRGIIGVDYVLPNGNKLAYEIISNNSVRVKDGDITIQGHLGRIVPGDYEDMTIDNGTQGMKRNDLIVARYAKDTSTGFESINLVVLKGTPSTSPVDPTPTIQDLTNGGTTRDVLLYRVVLDGLSITSVVKLFNVASSLAEMMNEANKTDNGWWKDKKTGLIFQWGRASQSTASDLRATVTFPIAFPVKMSSIIPCGIATTANDNYWMRSETDYKTYCIFRKNGNPGIIDEFHWMAVGY